MKKKRAKSDTKVPSLEKLLEYRNQNVIDRFKKELGVSEKFATMVFQDMLRYLWLSAKWRKQQRDFGLHELFIVIDEIWHMFILFSFDYERFSKKYFGRFVYHQPEVESGEKSAMDAKQFEKDLRAHMEAVYEEFGSKVFQRWFDDYPSKYSKVDIAKKKLAIVRAELNMRKRKSK